MLSLPSPTAQARDSRRERRIAKTLWRRAILARVVAGENRLSLAEQHKVSLSTIKRAVARALAECPPDEADSFAALQYARFSHALRLAETRIAEGDLSGVYALVTLAPWLERYRDRAALLKQTRKWTPGGLGQEFSSNIFERLADRMDRSQKPAWTPPGAEPET